MNSSRYYRAFYVIYAKTNKTLLIVEAPRVIIDLSLLFTFYVHRLNIQYVHRLV